MNGRNFEPQITNETSMPEIYSNPCIFLTILEVILPNVFVSSVCPTSPGDLKSKKRFGAFLVQKTQCVHVTTKHLVTNSPFSLFSSFVCPFFLCCFTSTVSSTPSYSDIQISPYDDISRTFRLQCWWLDIKLMQSRP